MSARMFDYPATPNERAVTRRNNERHQLAMFDTDPTPPHGIERPRSVLRDDMDAWNAARGCPVCAGDHAERDCTHGTAPTLPAHDPDRLTDPDRTTITEAIDAAIRANDGTWTWAGMPTLERIAWHSIGCDARDLRGSELLWIEHECRTAIVKHQPERDAR